MKKCSIYNKLFNSGNRNVCQNLDHIKIEMHFKLYNHKTQKTKIFKIFQDGLEGMHVICNNCRRAYVNQMVILRVKYMHMMEKVFVIPLRNGVNRIQMEKAINMEDKL